MPPYSFYHTAFLQSPSRLTNAGSPNSPTIRGSRSYCVPPRFQCFIHAFLDEKRISGTDRPINLPSRRSLANSIKRICSIYSPFCLGTVSISLDEAQTEFFIFFPLISYVISYDLLAIFMCPWLVFERPRITFKAIRTTLNNVRARSNNIEGSRVFFKPPRTISKFVN